MSKGGGNTTETKESKTQLPGWVDAASQSNYADMDAASKSMAGPYTGNRVAGQTQGQTDIIGGLLSNVGSTNPTFATGINTMNEAQGFTPDKINQQFLSGTSLDPYMNPYTKNVTDAAMAQMDVGMGQGLSQIGSQANKAKAFGGSRQGISEGVLQSQNVRDKASLVADQNSKNFQQAQAAAVGDIQRRLQTDTTNTANQITGEGIRMAGATGAGNLATAGQNAFLAGSAAGLAGQDQIQQQNQREIDAQKALYDEQRMDPIQRIQLRQGSLQASPYGNTVTQTGPGRSEDGTSKALGTASSIIGMAGTVASMFSDRRAKTDIKRLGKDPKTGLTLYAYRYKDDPKTYPKVVGPMAQEFERRYPGGTSKVGGHMVMPNLGFGVAA